VIGLVLSRNLFGPHYLDLRVRPSVFELVVPPFSFPSGVSLLLAFSPPHAQLRLFVRRVSPYSLSPCSVVALYGDLAFCKNAALFRFLSSIIAFFFHDFAFRHLCFSANPSSDSPSYSLPSEGKLPFGSFFQRKSCLLLGCAVVCEHPIPEHLV